MDMGFARREDRAALQALWLQCFGDTDDDTALYFDAYDLTRRVFTAREGAVITAMTVWFPVTVIGADGTELPAAYLYAVATAQPFRRRGVCRALLSFAEDALWRQGFKLTLLVPANAALAEFYGRLGYQPACYHREFSVTAGASGAVVRPVSAGEYYQLRQMCLWEQFVEYGLPELTYQQAICRRSGGDLVSVEAGGELGCAVVERSGDATLRVKELLLPQAAQAEAARGILAHFSAASALVRTPCAAADAKPFGMAKWLLGQPRSLRVYLGLAFD